MKQRRVGKILEGLGLGLAPLLVADNDVAWRRYAFTECPPHVLH